jgi:hypothetical protein
MQAACASILFEARRDPDLRKIYDTSNEFFGSGGSEVLEISGGKDKFEVCYIVGIRISPSWTKMEVENLKDILSGTYGWTSVPGYRIMKIFTASPGGDFWPAHVGLEKAMAFKNAYGKTYSELCAGKDYGVRPTVREFMEKTAKCLRELEAPSEKQKRINFNDFKKIALSKGFVCYRQGAG